MSYRRKNKYHYKEEKRSHIVFSTDPLSITGSTPTDEDNEKSLINVLKEAKRLKEGKYEAQRRELVLQALDEICQEWVRKSARTHNLPEEFASHSKVKYLKRYRPLRKSISSSQITRFALHVLNI